MTRTTPLAVAALLLSACGGGEPDFPPQWFDTPGSVLRALTATGAYYFLLEPQRPGGGNDEGIEGKLAACLAKAATTTCDRGGTVSRRDPRPMQVDSPFSDERFVVSTVVYDHCVFDGCGIDFTEVTGTSRFGCPESQWHDGGCDASPPSGRAITWSGTRPGDGDYHVRGERVTVRGREIFERTSRGEHHDAYDNAFPFRTFGIERVSVESFEGHYEIAGGPRRSYRGIRGTPDAPWRVSSTQDLTVSMEGALAFDNDTCHLGRFTVQTIEPIRYEFVEPFDRVVRAGELRLQGIDGTATVRFSTGAVTIVDTTGRTTTYRLGSDRLRETIRDCARTSGAGSADGDDGGDAG